MRKFCFLVFLNILIGCNNFNYSDIEYFENYEKGLLNATQNNQGVLLIFDFLGNPTNSVLKNLYNMELEGFLENYSIILLRTDAPGEDGIENRKLQKEKFDTNTQPTYYLLNCKGEVVKGPLGYCKKTEFRNFILSVQQNQLCDKNL